MSHMKRNKYAIRFPGYGNADSILSPDIFSETAVAAAEKTFLKTFHAFDSLTGFIIQKSRTIELEKQLTAQKRALDTEIEEGIEQLKNRYEEESKRLRLRTQQEKQEMDLELQRLKLETIEKAKDFSFSYEMYMKSNELFQKIIIREKAFIEETHKYIQLLEDDFSNRREYILYCDCERKSLELINRYLERMI